MSQDKQALYKKSNYIFLTQKDSEFLLFQTLNSKLYKIDEETWALLTQQPVILEDSVSKTHLQRLLKENILVEPEVDEKQLMYHQLYSIIYDNRLNITIIPTEACNFRCTYCFEEHRSNTMTDETEQRIIKFFKSSIRKYKSVSIDWFGGEPLLQRERVVRMMRQIKALGAAHGVPVYGTIITNGYFLDLELFEELIESGILYYQITIDGPESLHNRRRPLANGGSTYKRIIDNLSDIQKNADCRHFRFIIRSNIGKNDYEEYQNFLNDILPIVGQDKRFVFSCDPIQDWGGNSVIQMKNELFDQRAQLSKIQLPNLSKRKTSLFLDMLDNLASLRCSAGLANGFLINYDGSVQKCGMISGQDASSQEKQNQIGVIKPNGLLEIDPANSSAFLALAEEREKCNSCCWLPICLAANCPLSKVRGNELRCIIDLYGQGYIDELIWNLYNQQNATILQ